MDFYALTYSSMVILTLRAAFLSEKYVFCFIFKFIDFHLVEKQGNILPDENFITASLQKRQNCFKFIKSVIMFLYKSRSLAIHDQCLYLCKILRVGMCSAKAMDHERAKEEKNNKQPYAIYMQHVQLPWLHLFLKSESPRSSRSARECPQLHNNVKNIYLQYVERQMDLNQQVKKKTDKKSQQSYKIWFSCPNSLL